MHKQLVTTFNSVEGKSTLTLRFTRRSLGTFSIFQYLFTRFSLNILERWSLHVFQETGYRISWFSISYLHCLTDNLFNPLYLQLMFIVYLLWNPYCLPVCLTIQIRFFYYQEFRYFFLLVYLCMKSTNKSLTACNVLQCDHYCCIGRICYLQRDEAC